MRSILDLSNRKLTLLSHGAADEESRKCADYRYDNDENRETIGEVLDDCSGAYRKPDDEDITPGFNAQHEYTTHLYSCVLIKLSFIIFYLV